MLDAQAIANSVQHQQSPSLESMAGHEDQEAVGDLPPRYIAWSRQSLSTCSNSLHLALPLIETAACLSPDCLQLPSASSLTRELLWQSPVHSEGARQSPRLDIKPALPHLACLPPTRTPHRLPCRSTKSVRASELAARLEARRAAGLRRSYEVRQLLKKASEADLCFLCDATGSMQVWCCMHRLC